MHFDGAGQRRPTISFHSPNVNPFKTLPKDAPQRSTRDSSQGRGAPAGPNFHSGPPVNNFQAGGGGGGGFQGGFRGRGGVYARGGLMRGGFNQNYGNSNMNAFNNNMGFNNGMGGGGFNRGGMGGGFNNRGGPNMRGRGGMNAMMGGGPAGMMGGPMGMGGMGMPAMGMMGGMGAMGGEQLDSLSSFHSAVGSRLGRTRIIHHHLILLEARTWTNHSWLCRLQRHARTIQHRIFRRQPRRRWQLRRRQQPERRLGQSSRDQETSGRIVPTQAADAVRLATAAFLFSDDRYSPNNDGRP